MEVAALINEPLFWAFILTGFVCGSVITFLITRSSILSRSQALAERDHAQSQEAFTAEKNTLEQTWQAQKSELDQIIAVRDKTLEMKVENLSKLEEQIEKGFYSAFLPILFLLDSIACSLKTVPSHPDL